MQHNKQKIKFNILIGPMGQNALKSKYNVFDFKVILRLKCYNYNITLT